MSQETLTLKHHTITLCEDGSIHMQTRYGTVAIALASDEACLLRTWLQGSYQSPMQAESEQVQVIRTRPEQHTKVAECEGWTYKDYQTTTRYKTISLFYYGQPIAFLKQWSRYYVEDSRGNPKIRYRTLAEAVNAHQNDWSVRTIKEARAS